MQIDVSNAPSVFASMAGLGDNQLRYAPGRNQPGKCTRWNWLALGAFQNTTGLPHAVAAWENAPAEHRHSLSEKPFRGAIASFGAAPGPRWAGDQNWGYGDVAMFTGDGLDSDDWRDWMLVATDAAGVGNIAVVSFARRQAQTGGRRINGWQSSYGGAELVPGPIPNPTHDVGSVPALPQPATPAPPVQEEQMLAIRNTKNGALLGVAVGHVRHCTTGREFDLIVKATPGNVAQETDENTLKAILRAHGVPEAAVDPNWIVKNADASGDGHTWSAIGQLAKKLEK